ncbi:hypothetical protein CFP56_039592 [Quercus suber]|uniref:Uncharacterized protein n=1 Tax=Quercus suber TaxID=58331 RepID=A0AAW0IZ35_QUESU
MLMMSARIVYQRPSKVIAAMEALITATAASLTAWEQPMYTKLMLLISTIVTWEACAARKNACKLGEEVLQMFLKLTLPIRKTPNTDETDLQQWW